MNNLHIGIGYARPNPAQGIEEELNNFREELKATREGGITEMKTVSIAVGVFSFGYLLLNPGSSTAFAGVIIGAISYICVKSTEYTSKKINERVEAQHRMYRR